MTPSTACPRYGYQNLELARFCQSCGTPLPESTPSRPFMQASPSYHAPPRSGMDTGLKVVIIVIVLVVVLVVAVAATAFIFFAPANLISRVTPRPGPVTVTGLFLAIMYPNSASDGYFGSAYRYLSNAIPIYLQHGQSYQTRFTLTLGTGTDHTLDSITLALSDGFTLTSYIPNLPLTMTPGSSTTFTITLQAPNTDYTGPVTIDLFTH